MHLQIEDIKKAIEGKTVATAKVDRAHDEGLILAFTDGTVLSYFYNGREGVTELNGKEVML